MNKIREALKLKVGEKYREIYSLQIPKEFLEMKMKDFIEKYGDMDNLVASESKTSVPTISSSIPIPTTASNFGSVNKTVAPPVLMGKIENVNNLDHTKEPNHDQKDWRMSVMPDHSDSDHRRITIQGSGNGDFEFSMLLPNSGHEVKSQAGTIDQMSVEELKKLQDNLRAAQEHTNQLLAALGV